jgi:DNA topoisomerase IB
MSLEASAVPGLVRSDAHGPGITRVRDEDGIRYLDLAGAQITDTSTLDRIRGLRIPPAWAEVWISPDPLGHIQATGTDSKGRLQYLYHPLWREQRDAQKWGKQRTIVIRDNLVQPTIRALTRADNDLDTLWSYEQDNRWHVLHSRDVGNYIAGRAGGHFTAKEFRTWNATVLMALALANAEPSPELSGRKRPPRHPRSRDRRRRPPGRALASGSGEVVALVDVLDEAGAGGLPAQQLIGGRH